jgi:uncharacterized protein (DUF433 family)
MSHIEAVTKNVRIVTRIVDTRFQVADVVLMHVKHSSSIDWIVENHESLTRARIHAALAYYYDHQAEIEAEIDAIYAAEAAIAETAMTLEQLKAKIEARKNT